MEPSQEIEIDVEGLYCGEADLLSSYKVCGLSCFDLLNGPFSIVIQDGERTVLARDQHGQRSLFYRRCDDGKYRVSRNLSDLTAGCVLDQVALADYLLLGYIPAPRTFFCNVRKVAAGTSVVLEEGAEPRVMRFWKPDLLAPRKISYPEALEETERLICKSLERCLNLGYDIGSLLSGGIDSNLLFALAAKLGAEPLVAFTVGFENGAYDERSLAALTAHRCHAEHFTCLAHPQDCALMPELLTVAGEPFGDASLLPSALAMRLASEHGKNAVLCGDGGDEIFGGYRRYQFMLLRQLLGGFGSRFAGGMLKALCAFLPGGQNNRSRLRSLGRTAVALSMGELEAYASFQGIFSQQELTCLLAEVPAENYLAQWRGTCQDNAALEWAEKCNLLDLLHYLPDDCERKAHIASQYAGVVPLCPLLDMELTRFVLSLPREYRFTSRQSKRLLRDIARKYISPELLAQPKRGFGVPLADWFRSGQLKFHCALSQINAQFAGKLLEEHQSTLKDNSAKLWALACAHNAEYAH